jgi:hypothetical protein
MLGRRDAHPGTGQRPDPLSSVRPTATMSAMAQHKAPRGSRTKLLVGALIVIAVAVAAVVVVVVSRHPGSHPETSPPSSHLGTTHHTTTTSTSTTTTAPTTTTTSTLPPPAAGFVAGHVTAVGDSVMLDYQTPIQADIPGIDVEASVSRQWGAGEEILGQLKSEGQLGAEVVVALSTNGPISSTDFDTMMRALQGASRVVFVNVHVDRPWQDPNNAVLSQGAARYPNVVIADWASLAAANPQWFGSDGTHLAIDGSGADALASLITTTLSQG